MSDLANTLRNSISSIVTLLVGLFVFVSVPSQIAVFDSGSPNPVTARTLPYLITSAIIILSLLLIASNAIETQKDETDSSANVPGESINYIRVLLAFVAIALWIVLLPFFGYNLATVLLVVSVMLIVGGCRWWQIAILALALSFPVQYSLAVILRVYLPSGSLFS